MEIQRFMWAVLPVLPFLLLGCGSGKNVIFRDSTFVRPDSPYEGEVTVHTLERADTTTTRTSEATKIEFQRSERCTYQRVTLRNRPKLHLKQPPISYVQATDYDCDIPSGVVWDDLLFRRTRDQLRYERNPRLRQEVQQWLEHYLVMAWMQWPLDRVFP